MKALDLITSALRLVNVAAADESLDVGMANDSLSALNDMIDAWNAERTAIFTVGSNDFPFTLSKQSYTLGTGGDFNMIRPARIEGVSAILTSNPAVPVEIPMALYSTEDWQTKVPVKNVPGTFPYICYDDGGFPNRTLNFWPIPTAANSVRIYSWQPLGAPAALSTVITFPPGYAEALRYNLAVRLAAEFAQPVPAPVAQIAIAALARVKTMNAPDLKLRSDLAADPSVANYRAIMFGIPY